MKLQKLPEAEEAPSSIKDMVFFSKSQIQSVKGRVGSYCTDEIAVAILAASKGNEALLSKNINSAKQGLENLKLFLIHVLKKKVQSPYLPMW